tara:strand:- start:1379 stop:1798 length:420 start_codon:yes stop_codon:yes gene_type:complete
MKDYQVKEVYKSEEEIDIFNNGRLLSKDEVSEYVKQFSIWADIETPNIFCKDEYHVTDVAQGSAKEIFLPVFAQNPWYICHEMSHVILDSWQHVENDHHGPNFCYVYLELIGWVLGRETKKTFERTFLKNKVKINKFLV